MEQPEQLDYQIYKEYEVLQKAGKGTYGIVYKARHKRNGTLVAIKKIIDAFQNLIDAKRTYRELNYLLQLNHPCIVKLQCILHLNRKGLFNQPSTTRLVIPPFSQEERGSNTDKNFSKPMNQAKHVYTVFEFMETDLSCALKKCQQLQPIQRKYIAYQLLHGISYLHRSGLVHRDIKPSNILLNCNDLQVKICDFGMARLKVDLENSNEGVLTEYVASRWYRPPEALLGITTCCESIDLWGIGCVLAELVLKTPLFQGKSTLDQLELIMRSIGVPSNKQIDKLSSQQAQYVLKNFSFTKRKKFKSIQETLNSCSCQQIDLIMNLLKFDPTMRITAQQALKHAYFDDIHEMRINNQIQNCSRSVAKILDFSLIPLQAQGDHRHSNSNPGIDYYRALIQQLERYAERSTNRSGNFLHPCDTSKDTNINIQTSFHPQTELQEGFKEKSTKESDFVVMHKHHYLTSTHSLIQNVKTQVEIKEKEKSEVQDKKEIKKQQKKKKAFSKVDLQRIFQKGEKKQISKNQSKKELLTRPKAESKDKKSLTVIKSKQSIHKIQQAKPVKQRQSSQKKILNATQHPFTSKKRPSASRDSKSLISNVSNQSLHHPSISKQKMIQRMLKEGKRKSCTNQLIQKLNKSTLVLKKSGNAVKSSKFSGHFKKQG